MSVVDCLTMTKPVDWDDKNMACALICCQICLFSAIQGDVDKQQPKTLDQYGIGTHIPSILRGVPSLSTTTMDKLFLLQDKVW